MSRLTFSSRQFSDRIESEYSARDDFPDSHVPYSMAPAGSNEAPEGQQGSSADDNFKVVVRVRPPLPRETASPQFCNVVRVDQNQIQIDEIVNDPSGRAQQLVADHVFTFDRVYAPDSTQEDVYSLSAQQAVESAIHGYNATILAYGQTSSGKTYTMDGFTYDEHDPQRGIIPRAMSQIFDYISHYKNRHAKFLVRVRCLQIYQEDISDLMKPERDNLKMREKPNGLVYVDGLSEWVVSSPQEFWMCMERSADTRHTAETRLNDRSSRSHALFTIMIEKDDSMPGQTERHITQGKLNLVDLAGSERVRLTGATGDRLKETKKINLSLSALGNVISALVDGRPHVPYRDSKLTRLLEDSLGGNCKTTLVATISPALEFFGESLSTLKFANRAKNIRNHATINEDIGKQSLLQKYQRELKKLREQLKHKNADLVDKRHFLKLESECQRHKEDKMKVLHALEERSLEVEAEKQERQKLEEEIQDLQDKMVDVDGVAETEGFRTAIAEIENDYKHKERELEDKWMALDEKERQQNYIKGLLVRQRDVLIQVTNKLNMLDQESEEWKEKEDGYRSRIRQLEDDLDEEMKRTFAARKENLMNFEDGEGGGAASDSKVRELEFMVETLRSEKHHLSMELEKKEDELADTQRLVNENVAKYLSDSAVIQEVNKMKTKSKSKLSATVGAAVRYGSRSFVLFFLPDYVFF